MNVVFARNAFEGEPVGPDRQPYLPKGFDYSTDPQGFVLGVGTSAHLSPDVRDPFLDNLSRSGFVVRPTENNGPYEESYWAMAFRQNHSGISVPIDQIATLTLAEFSRISRNDLFSVLASIAGITEISIVDVNYGDLTAISSLQDPPTLAQSNDLLD